MMNAAGLLRSASVQRSAISDDVGRFFMNEKPAAMPGFLPFCLFCCTLQEDTFEFPE